MKRYMTPNPIFWYYVLENINCSCTHPWFSYCRVKWESGVIYLSWFSLGLDQFCQRNNVGFFVFLFFYKYCTFSCVGKIVGRGGECLKYSGNQILITLRNLFWLDMYKKVINMDLENAYSVFLPTYSHLLIWVGTILICTVHRLTK